MSNEPRPEPGNARDRLDSWKEIAVYLNRSERTVRRWEEHEGLPISSTRRRDPSTRTAPNGKSGERPGNVRPGSTSLPRGEWDLHRRGAAGMVAAAARRHRCPVQLRSRSGWHARRRVTARSGGDGRTEPESGLVRAQLPSGGCSTHARRTATRRAPDRLTRKLPADLGSTASFRAGAASIERPLTIRCCSPACVHVVLLERRLTTGPHMRNSAAGEGRSHP